MSTVALGPVGRPIHGPTSPGAASPCSRTSPLTPKEVEQVVDLLADGRREHHAVDLPPPLRTRDWESVMTVVLALDHRLGWPAAGWKIGGADPAVRNAEGCPTPAPGRVYRRGLYTSPATLPRRLFIHHRNCECELAFKLATALPARDAPYSEAEVAAAVECVMPAIEVGDSVFGDWYGASSFYGACLDNNGGAALVCGPQTEDWRSLDLASARLSVYVNGTFVKSGFGSAAMGDPLSSLTWLANWLRSRGLGLQAGEIVSTGTCTGHCFVAPGDSVRLDSGPLGTVEAEFE